MSKPLFYCDYIAPAKPLKTRRYWRFYIRNPNLVEFAAVVSGTALAMAAVYILSNFILPRFL